MIRLRGFLALVQPEIIGFPILYLCVIKKQ